MSNFLNAINKPPHAEERPKGASRSTHDLDAMLVFRLSPILSHAREPGPMPEMGTGLRRCDVIARGFLAVLGVRFWA